MPGRVNIFIELSAPTSHVLLDNMTPPPPAPLEETQTKAKAAYAGWKKMLGEDHPHTMRAKALLERLEGKN